MHTGSVKDTPEGTVRAVGQSLPSRTLCITCHAGVIKAIQHFKCFPGQNGLKQRGIRVQAVNKRKKIDYNQYKAKWVKF